MNMFSERGEGFCACGKQQTRHLTELGHISIDTGQTQSPACFLILPSAVKAQHSGYSVPDISFPPGGSHRGAP